MAIDVYFKSEIQNSIVAGIVLAARMTAGQDVEFLRGILALAQHQALAFGLSWQALVADARQNLTGDGCELLDAVAYLVVAK